MEKQLGDIGEPYRRAPASRFRWVSRGGIAAGATLLGARGSSSGPAAIVAGALLSVGALSARWSVFEAGRQSAADPKYVVGPQREAITRGERAGAARRQPVADAAG